MSPIWNYVYATANTHWWFGPDRQVVGVLAALELFMSRTDERENEFLIRLLEKHHARLRGQFDRHVVSTQGVLLPP